MSTVHQLAPLRILFVVGSADRGGAELQLVRLACGLRARGHKPTVAFLTRGGPLTDILDEHGVPWSVLGFAGISRSRDTPRSVFGLVRLATILGTGRFDVVHPWLALSIALSLAPARLLTPRTRRVAAFRGTERDLGWWSPLLARSLRAADAITINAAHLLADVLHSGGSASRTSLVPNGVALPERTATPGSSPVLALVVANLRQVKGIDVLVGAVGRCGSALRVEVIGEGTERAALQRLIDDGGLTDQFVLRGDVPDPSVLLTSAQLLIHPSRAEGTPNAVLEAMAAGLPIIATDVGGTRAVVEAASAGIVVAPDDPQALASAIDTLASDPELRVRLGANAREGAGEWSWDRSLDSHELLYRELCALSRSERRRRCT